MIRLIVPLFVIALFASMLYTWFHIQDPAARETFVLMWVNLGMSMEYKISRR